MKHAHSLHVSHPSLRVVFDCVARPHLIILEKGSIEFPKFAKNLSKEQTESLIECYEEIQNHLDAGSSRFTLTTHHGSYVSNDTHFHAHIWMDIERYKTLLHQCHYQPYPQRYKSLHIYVKEAEGYTSKMSKKHRKYLNDEIKEVEKVHEKVQEKNETIKVSCPKGYKIVFHHGLPYIGFRCKGSQTKAEILYDVTQFANKYNMTEGEDGCNACLGGQPALKFSDGNAVDAFLLASVGTFYKMLCNVDVALADPWWDSFQKSTVANPVLH